MIYLIDSELTENSHSKFLIDIIRQHTSVEVRVFNVYPNMSKNQLCEVLYKVAELVIPSDIILCAWAVSADDILDEVFEQLTELCTVVAAAGNFKEPIENYTPARTKGVITVGTLNKQGLVASLSNYSNYKEIVWLPGTNYDVGWKNSSGTSISAALYAAFLAESIKNNDADLLGKLIENHKSLVYSKIMQIDK